MTRHGSALRQSAIGGGVEDPGKRGPNLIKFFPGLHYNEEMVAALSQTE